MREIKFRAWHKEFKKMFYQSGLDELVIELRNHNRDCPRVALVLSLDRVVCIAGWNGASLIPTDKFELMQYTGLKDKNGKEIYEGDILKYTYPAGYALCEVRFGEWDNGESYEDHLGGNGWYIKEWAHYEHGDDKNEEIKVSLSGFTDYPMNNHKMEVIGNLWENPELLEAK